MSTLTVIIPTFNRNALLEEVIEGYCRQTETAGVHELIIVDDGSTDGTGETVLNLAKRTPFPLRYIRQSKRGPASARNRGIQEAQTGTILFTDSDVVPQRKLVSEHLEWHRRYPQDYMAMLGYVTWPSEPAPTPFMQWYGEMKLFAYGHIHDQQQLDFRYFYSCNLSIKKDFLTNHGLFDEDFEMAAYEDTELGYRLCSAGLQLIYNRQAVAYHHQFFRFVDACRKSQGNTTASQKFYQKQAGRAILEQQKKRESRVGYRVARRAAKALAVALSPAKNVLDSNVPLPSIFYRLCYWHYATRNHEPMKVG